MGIREFFATINWAATLQVVAIRIGIASVLWSLAMLLFGPLEVAGLFRQSMAMLLGLTLFVAIAIPAIGLDRANVPLVGLIALPAWLIVIADPLVKIIHINRPEWVPVEEFKLFNPPVLAVFSQRQDDMQPLEDSLVEVATPGTVSGMKNEGVGVFDKLPKS